jgi:uncharacterized protein
MVRSENQDLVLEYSLSKLKDYFLLREKIDLLSKRLTDEHKDHLKCEAGCHKCCMDFSIFPVEYFSIHKEINDKKFIINTIEGDGECLFLITGLCSIYESRPLICRTHGLPMFRMGEDEWELSYCELNFTSEELPELNESNTFPQDLYNSKLFLINREFVNSFKDKRYSDTDLLSLRELATEIIWKNGC